MRLCLPRADLSRCAQGAKGDDHSPMLSVDSAIHREGAMDAMIRNIVNFCRLSFRTGRRDCSERADAI